MNVQIRHIDDSRKNLLETDKIVHVKVLERKGGNAAVIELNGYKTEALIEAETPDNFLAFAELGASSADSATIKLRVMSSFRNTKEFGDYNRQKVVDSIKMFLLENNLPLDPEYFETALLLRSAGLKLSASLLRILHYAAKKNEGTFLAALTGFLKNGMTIDSEFVDLFAEIRRVLLSFLKDNAAKNPGTAPVDGEKKDPLSALTSLLEKYLGDGNNYRAFLLKENEEDILVQFRIAKKPERERFYFELTGESIGTVLLTVDKTPDSYHVTVLMNPGLYRETIKSISSRKEGLRSGLQAKIPDRKLLLEFTEQKDDVGFWQDEGETNGDLSMENLFNLDISV